MRSPQRGEVWIVDLGMAAKVRPAVVLSIPADDIDRALVTVVAHTTSPRESRFEVGISVPFLRTGVFVQLASVERAVCLWLGLPSSWPEA